MTHHEELRERYEDALFALLMDEVARAEGQQALRLADQAEECPELAASEESCRGTIRRTLFRQQSRRVGRASLRALGRAAMATGLAATLFVGAFASSETVRAGTLNLIAETTKSATGFYFEGTGSISNPLLCLVPQWLPEGFVVTDTSADEISSWVHYERSPEEFIELTYIQADGTVLGVDTEDANVETIQINGQSATLVEKGTSFQLVYLTANQSYFVHVLSEHIVREDFLRCVDGLT